jgi:surfactin synthase thioesterase subunit
MVVAGARKEESASEGSARCGTCAGTLVSLVPWRSDRACAGACGRRLCYGCRGRFPLIRSAEALAACRCEELCEGCFMRCSALDFERACDVVVPPAGVAVRGVAVWAHGGGSHRLMFARHAARLAELGWGAVLVDMPAHGARRGEALTRASLAAAVEEGAAAFPGDAALPRLYVGASLGAYLALPLLAAAPRGRWAAAALLDMGQNVGPDASLAARLALSAMRASLRWFSNEALMQQMAKMAAAASDLDSELVLETCFKGGQFFDRSAEIVDALRGVEPAKELPSIHIPLLFINGSADHRDSEQRWLALAPNKASQLLVYEQGDHFFMHSRRYFARTLDDIHRFFAEHVDPPRSSTELMAI